MKRHTRAHRCPVCGGADGDPRGQSKRCSGFTSDDGEWCHCSREELAGALEQEDGGTYAHRLHGSCKCGTTHGEDLRAPTREIEATYDYLDEGGALLFQVVRFVGKDFRQRKPDGAGGWEWKLNGVRRVPYRLAELLADDGERPVYIPEGEKDVDALWKRGHVATCNPMGAGKWSAIADVARTALQGRDVIVIADADEPGRRHALEVGASLRDVARSVRVLECTRGKDVSDHLAAGGTLEELVPLGSAPEPSASDPLRGLEHLSKVAVVGRDRLVELAERPVVWLWEYIATAGLTILLAAGPGSGKTTLLFLLVAARANRGQPVQVLGRTMTPAPAGRYIVIVENEHSDESAARILRKSCRLLGIDEAALDTIILVARGSVRVGSPAWQDIERLIAAGLVSDVVLDTLARCTPDAASDANDEQEQVAFFDLVAKAIELAPTPDARPTCWVAAHTRKCDGIPTLNDVSGSTQRAGQADVVLLMAANRTGERVTSVSLVFGKVREKDAEDWPAPVEYTVTKAGIVIAEPDDASDDRPLEERILARLALGPKTKNALATDLGRSKADVDSALTALFEARRIRSTQIAVRGRGYKAFELRSDAPTQGFPFASPEAAE